MLSHKRKAYSSYEEKLAFLGKNEKQILIRDFASDLF
jgi:hypothetical protein